MQQAICGFHQDDENHWVAELGCGHFQHVRHKPPFINRLWVVSFSGRKSMIGHKLKCKKCDEGMPEDKS
ncbi:DUF3565 domain-containing protein [Colwellia sp. E2M01]|uniref:DUF3565 domain-containing protein n=1 Tax=Colwellia sp. E2M01 TaxID=2841561 RepID=UPI001C0A1DB6|nr:DUF3565 domain-containing protein [Colwellia sp. E2M01]MBU2871722.1 DUF3565 domain-containing protein [Colwellia sp. E2M01]